MKAILQIFVLGMVGLLCGCSGLSADRYLANKQEFMLKQNMPHSYVCGYIDGCSSGRRLAEDKRFSFRKDSHRAEKDALYARGWQEGQINCKNELLMEQQREQRLQEASSNVDEARHQRVKAESVAAEKEMQEIWDELKK